MRPAYITQTPLYPIYTNRVSGVFYFSLIIMSPKGGTTMLHRIRFILSVFTLLTSLFTLHSSYASTIQLPQTGQNVCYDATDAPIACTNTTGQDVNIQAGKPWPNPRFTINKLADGTTENGTVTDNLTGLVWLKDLTCFPFGQTWATALNLANTLKGDNSQCSLNDGSVAGDWRLPNIDELASMATNSSRSPSIWLNNSARGFTGVKAGPYWSSTTHVSNAVNAWSVNMDTGYVNYDFIKDPGGVGIGTLLYVWPVRGGQ
jgi:hypothetical protein